MVTGLRIPNIFRRRQQMCEASTYLEHGQFLPMLRRLSALFAEGLGVHEIALLMELAANTSVNSDGRCTITVLHESQRTEVHVRICKDSEEGITLYLHAPFSLTSYIDEGIDAFFAERDTIIWEKPLVSMNNFFAPTHAAA